MEILDKSYISVSIQDLLQDAQEILDDDDDFEDEILFEMIGLDIDKEDKKTEKRGARRESKYHAKLIVTGYVWPPREEKLYNGKDKKIEESD